MNQRRESHNPFIMVSFTIYEDPEETQNMYLKE